MQVLKALGLSDTLQTKIVQGNNIGQTFQFVETGNAELGFVAGSQVAFIAGGSRWLVPAELHNPIAQDAVLLKQGDSNEAAKALLAFLRSAPATQIIARFGYGIGAPTGGVMHTSGNPMFIPTPLFEAGSIAAS